MEQLSFWNEKHPPRAIRSIEGRPWIVYALTDPRTSEVRYVGATFRSRQRFNEHLSRARMGGRTHRDHWLKNLFALGLRPIVSVLEHGVGEGWQEAERRQIASRRAGGRLTNHTDGGDGTPGCIPSVETRALWSRQRRGKKYAPGRVGPMRGRTHTPEAREKIRRAGTGRGHTDESKAKISKARTGKKLSPEHKAKLRIAHLGMQLTAEHKAKIAASTKSMVAVRVVRLGSTCRGMHLVLA